MSLIILSFVHLSNQQMKFICEPCNYLENLLLSIFYLPKTNGSVVFPQYCMTPNERNIVESLYSVNKNIHLPLSSILGVC